MKTYAVCLVWTQFLEDTFYEVPPVNKTVDLLTS